MSMEPHPVWFKDVDGKWSQINNVIEWAIATPLVARGTYRDKPPAIPAAAAQSLGGFSENSQLQVVGGVVPESNITNIAGSVNQCTLIAQSSVAQDDEWLHNVLRYSIGPEPMIFFRTADAGSPALPTGTTYGTDRPAVPTKTTLNSGGKFPVITGDCAFGWTPRCGVTNTPPQSWVVFDPANLD